MEEIELKLPLAHWKERTIFKQHNTLMLSTHHKDVWHWISNFKWWDKSESNGEHVFERQLQKLLVELYSCYPAIFHNVGFQNIVAAETKRIKVIKHKETEQLQSTWLSSIGLPNPKKQVFIRCREQLNSYLFL